MTKVHVLRVFTDASSNYGDLATVVVDEGRKISDSKRQQLARKLDTGETAFINDLASADISIMHPQVEIDFAGVAALGAAKLLSDLNVKPIIVMKGRGGDITVSQSGELTWVRASLATMPPWNHKQLESAIDVERTNIEDTKTWEHTMVWAWIDEREGLIRARTFASDWDIPEAQGNGSGSMMLAAIVNRPIQIKHGDGSIIYAKPAPDNCADIGGRVTEQSNIII